MSKHVIDQRKPSTGARTRAFVMLEKARDDRLHPASQSLHQRGDTARGNGRLRQFLRIARGQSA